MPWLELSLTLDPAQQPEAERALEQLGALAVTLADADADSADEHAIFEPGAGETPLWSRTRVEALFDADADRAHLADVLARELRGARPDDLRFRRVADQDWERAWMERFRPMRFGNRLWVYPWNTEPPDDDTLAVVRLDPGLAFGTGTHPTTALCLEWLDGLALTGRHIIDYGCGSGILALAALKLGAARATGIDHDPQALAAARNNATRNATGARLEVYLADAAPAAPADVLVANILAGPLTGLASQLAALCHPGAAIALSGILDGQHEALQQVYTPWFEHFEITCRDGWVRIAGRRKA